MASVAKLAAPDLFRAVGPQPILERVFAQKGTLVSAPPGFFEPAALDRLLERQRMPALWYPVAAEDRDPATLLLGLAAGADRLFPETPAPLPMDLRRRPGEVYGWNSHFTTLAQHLAGCAERQPFALVLQHVDALSPPPALLDLLWAALFPWLPDSSLVICTSHTDRTGAPHFASPAAQLRLPENVQTLTAAHLALDTSAARRMADDAGIDLADADLLRLLAWSKGRAGALAGFLDLVRRVGPTNAVKRLARCSTFQERMAQAALFETDEPLLGAPQSLALALRLEFLPPALLHLLDAPTPPRPSPFFQTNAAGWVRLNCLWRAAIRRAAIRPPVQPHPALLTQAAEILAAEGQPIAAAALWQAAGWPDAAGKALEQQASDLLDSGQWQTLSTLLAALPSALRSARPGLCAAEGELAAARGQTRRARDLLKRAARGYQQQRRPEPASRALLALSCLAAWDAEPDLARDLARQALERAEQARQPEWQTWAHWQLAVLAARRGQQKEAETQVRSAVHAAQPAAPSFFRAFFAEADRLTRQLLSLHQEKEALTLAMQQAAQAEQEAFSRLSDLLAAPPPTDLTEPAGWSRTPLFLKLPGAGMPEAGAAEAGAFDAGAFDAATFDSGAAEADVPPLLRRWAAALRRAFPFNLPLVVDEWPGLNGADAARPELPQAAGRRNIPERNHPVHSTGRPAQAVGFLPVLIPHTAAADTPLAAAAMPLVTAMPLAAAAAPLAAAAAAPPAQPAAELSAYLLGGFRILLHGAALQNWPGARSRALFTYLLLNHGQSVSRDTLMETFWPDASPDSARNCLNVAMYGLRQTLKQASEPPGGSKTPGGSGPPVIRSQENGYQINPGLAVWLDFQVFKQAAAEGFALEAQGDIDAAASAYSAALGLYQGDFLTDFLYEDWASLEREQLRVLYLENLEHLSLIEFNRGQLEASIHHCQAILARDACREDAHCRLMRCYSRLGQGPLALRQYQMCVEALHRELDVPPAPATFQLYEQIRRREPV